MKRNESKQATLQFPVVKSFCSSKNLKISELVSRKRLSHSVADTKSKKAHVALHSEVPTSLPGRENEIDALKSFVLGNLQNFTPASMYISGPPGSGKTACLSIVMSEEKVKSNCTSVYINCTSITTANSLYRRIVEEFGLKKKVNAEKKHIDVIKHLLKSSKTMILLVLDEIDQLESKNQSLLYSVFEWPAIPDSKVILIGIANALDFTDRTLPRLRSNLSKITLLHFPSYSKEQIVNIINQRLQEADVENVLPENAVHLLAGKVAAVSGDVRRALDIARRVVDLAENTCSGFDTSLRVQLSDVLSVINNVYGTTSQVLTTKNHQNSHDGEEFPLQQKLILCSVILMKQKMKAKQHITLGKLHDIYRKVCERRNLFVLDMSEFISTCSLLESRGILSVKGNGCNRLTKVCLQWDHKELVTALQDKALLADILNDKPHGLD